MECFRRNDCNIWGEPLKRSHAHGSGPSIAAEGRSMPLSSPSTSRLEQEKQRPTKQGVTTAKTRHGPQAMFNVYQSGLTRRP